MAGRREIRWRHDAVAQVGAVIGTIISAFVYGVLLYTIVDGAA